MLPQLPQHESREWSTDTGLERGSPSARSASPRSAHGYRHKHHDGVDLRYDTKLGLYVVIGHRDTWFVDDLYLRWTKGAWQSSVRIGGNWAAMSVEKIPESLRHAKAKKQKNKKK